MHERRFNGGVFLSACYCERIEKWGMEKHGGRARKCECNYIPGNPSRALFWDHCSQKEGMVKAPWTCFGINFGVPLKPNQNCKSCPTIPIQTAGFLTLREKLTFVQTRS